MKLVTASQAAEMDKTAYEDYSIPNEILMENAASAACHVIKERYSIEGNNFLILCGTGNNGGDGLALARLLYSEGGAPLVLLNGNRDSLKETAYYNYKILKNFPFEICSDFSLDLLSKEIEQTDIIIDCLLGTGLNRIIEGKLKKIIDLANQSDKKIVSLDIPSGVNGDTGQIMGVSIKAQSTISFGALKPGNLLYPGYNQNGELSLSRISLPPEIYDFDQLKTNLNIPMELPERSELGHKMSFGDILNICGSASYYGAPYFCACAALKSGAGFSRLALPGSMIQSLAIKLPEAVFMSMNETVDQSLSLTNLPLLLKTAEKVHCTIIGPGLSLNEETSQLIIEFARLHKNPLIIDGDALSAISNKEQLISYRSIPAILTPHLGEMSRLLNCSVQSLKEDPIRAVRTCAEHYKSIVVMKGPHSLIALPNGSVFINLTGNSGLGTAGSGDILTGIIAAMNALGLNLEESVKAGVFIHGVAGDMAAEKYGKDSLTASSILEYLPQAIKEYRENYKILIKNYVGQIQLI